MYYGVSYYPEHKSKEDLEWDIKLIKESGINTVRMGEFSWCRMERSPGCYDFSWLDPVIGKLGEAGIRTIVGTPTACPPAWMVEQWPDMLYQDNRRIRRPFGGRRHGCYNHEKFREACAAIAGAIGRHYGANPYVAGFQIDNELAQEGTGRCTCDNCRKKFQSWLEQKYKDIDTFNRRSGAVFWSQEYTHFGQINPPVGAIEPGAQTQIRDFYENPTIRLEFERFSSECQIEFQNLQADILKTWTTHPVTTNGTGLATNSIDYYKGFENLDCYAFDYYPNLRDAWVDSFPYAFGQQLEPLADAAFPSEVGILLNYDSHWALSIKPVNQPDFNYLEFARKLYCNLERAGIHPDVLSSDSSLADITRYRALLLPASFILSEQTAEKLKIYVEHGGILLTTFLTSVKNEDNLGWTRPLPANLTDLLGVTVQEVEPVLEGNHTTLDIYLNRSGQSGETHCAATGRKAEAITTTDNAWSELLEGTAKTVARYTSSYKQGATVISEHTYGAGKAIYIGADLPDRDLRTLLDHILSPVCRYKDEIPPADGIQVISRIYKNKQLYYLFNFTGREYRLTMPEGKTNYLTGELLSGETTLEPNGFLVAL